MCADNEGKCGCGAEGEAAQAADGCGCGCGGGEGEATKAADSCACEGVAPNNDEKTLAMLAHLLAIFTAFIGPLVIYLVKKKQSAFVAKQSKEALNFWISICLATFAMFFVSIIVGFIPFLGIVVFFLVMLGITALGIYALVMYIVAAIRANDGVDFKYPYTLRLIK